MTKKIKHIPNLRFPEFKNSGEWELKALSKITSSIFDGTHQTPQYVDKGVPFFSVENLVSNAKNRFISRDDYNIATAKNKPEKGDILLTRIGNIGFSSIVSWDYDFSIYVTLACIKSSSSFNSYFLHSFFQTNWYQKEITSKSLLTAVPCKINMRELKSTKVLLPPSPLSIKEQSKIAECLSSLDNYINATQEKIESLQAHKKGLMQQLLPALGKDSPLKRVPKFEQSKKWGPHLMDEMFKIRNGYTPSKSNPKFWENGTIPWFRMEDIREHGHILSDSIQHITKEAVKGKGLFPANSIIVATTATIGEHALIIVDSLANQQFTFLTKRKSFDNQIDMKYFYYYMYIIDEWCKQHTNTGGFALVDMNGFKRLSVSLPSIEEQKEIAECFTSIDDLIDSTKQKLVMLQNHKRGLMQQLFPII